MYVTSVVSWDYDKKKQYKYNINYFDVLPTVHLSIILVINQLNAQILVL